MAYIIAIFVLGIAAVSALPADSITRVFDESPSYQHMTEDSAGVYLEDLLKSRSSNFDRAARYNADAQNVYHLFTRQNPSLSHPIVLGNNATLTSSYFNSTKTTVVIIHGWTNNITSAVFTVLVPAFLAGEDANVIAVDWSAGADDSDYYVAVNNTVTSGEAVARFIDWLNEVSGATPDQYHIVGHSLGGQQAGIVGRNVNGDVAFITACDPAGPAWEGNANRFNASDGLYTEIIHTNAGVAGYLETLGDVDFYPNGGTDMPGCDGISCDHSRSFYYLAESVVSGGFTGTECASYVEAMAANCTLDGTLNMGGLTDKTGSTGVYYLVTNAGQPFSQG